MAAKATASYENSYADWKGWERCFQFDGRDDQYFRGEMRDVPVAGRRVFEVGFGSGSFLAWAAAQGAIVSGCDLIPGVVERGQSLGYDARLGDPRAVIDEATERFDIIVAFDVLEHIPSDELIPFMKFLTGLLKEGGVLIARTPNGESPFGGFCQHGDITHVTTLSNQKFRQIAPLVGLKLTRCSNQFRVANPDAGYWGYRDPLRFWLRDLIEGFICFVYGYSRRPLDLNVMVVMRRVDDAPQS